VVDCLQGIDSIAVGVVKAKKADPDLLQAPSRRTAQNRDFYQALEGNQCVKHNLCEKCVLHVKCLSSTDIVYRHHGEQDRQGGGHDPWNQSTGRRASDERRGGLQITSLSFKPESLQNLVENIVRQKIYQTTYWKESCFALTAESLIEKAVELKGVGGTYGGQNAPTQFLCLILKMLQVRGRMPRICMAGFTSPCAQASRCASTQIQPAKEIIIEYIKNEDFKYVRMLGG